VNWKPIRNVWPYSGDMEMPLQPILAGMEAEGIGLDIFELEAYGDELGRGIDDLVKEIHGLCGHEFNIASPKQLQTVLFDERGLTPGKKTKTGFSTDNSVLTDLAKEDPVPEKILLYRSLTKLKSTYVDVLPQLVHPDDGRIHTSYSQTGAATGRLSSNNPNLQNIPVRDENGRRIRKAFKSRPGYLFVSADYSQIELVVLAHMSGDQALSDAFREGVDVHTRTAALLLGVDPGDVTPDQRRMAKTVNFGVMYGMSAFRLSNDLGISRKEAKHFIDAYFTTYRGIKTFVEQAVSQAEADGGVRTLYGRFRPLPGINSRNRVEKSAAERAAVNSRIQGTAADIMKVAMLDVDSGIKEHHSSAKMLLQVHDELLLEVPESEVEAVSKFLKTTMEGAVELSIPLRTSVETGPSWGDIH
jgi:DNA polymerase-1